MFRKPAVRALPDPPTTTPDMYSEEERRPMSGVFDTLVASILQLVPHVRMQAMLLRALLAIGLVQVVLLSMAVVALWGRR
jgi:hypothetical protein